MLYKGYNVRKSSHYYKVNTCTYHYINNQSYICALNANLHNLRIVSGFFLFNNDDSFNTLGLLKKKIEIYLFPVAGVVLLIAIFALI